VFAVRLHPLFVGGRPERIFKPSRRARWLLRGRGAAYNFKSIAAAEEAAQHYSDEIKKVQYTSFFATTKRLAQNRPPSSLNARDHQGMRLAQRTGERKRRHRADGTTA